MKENKDLEEKNMERKRDDEERRRRNREMDRSREKEDGYDRRDGDRDGKRSGDKYKGTISGFWMKGFDNMSGRGSNTKYLGSSPNPKGRSRERSGDRKV